MTPTLATLRRAAEAKRSHEGLSYRAFAERFALPSRQRAHAYLSGTDEMPAGLALELAAWVGWLAPASPSNRSTVKPSPRPAPATRSAPATPAPATGFRRLRR